LFQPNEFDLSRVNIPVLVIASGADRLLPSVLEARFLTRTLPNAQMVVLPDSGHACLLENDIDLYTLIQAYSVAEKSYRPNNINGNINPILNRKLLN
jgi:pimeloyl-ACP methyl ester carboxylesterase